MFEIEVYTQRRKNLTDNIDSGIILFLGNEESPMNYPGNPYHYRQDSTFLYYWGLESAGLAAIIDVEENREVIFGYDYTIDDIIWMGPQPTLRQRASQVGVNESIPLEKLQEVLNKGLTKGRKIHYLPQYRADNLIKLENLLGIKTGLLNENVSVDFIKAVVAQRSIKSEEEIKEIESSLEIAHQMHTMAMKRTKAGIYEREIAGIIEGIANSLGNGVSFPIIFSIHGETLHNHSHENMMKDGDIAINDSGAESLRHYASDITRTIPVSGKFSTQQKEIYEIVLNAQLESIKVMQPGKKFREVHLTAARVIADGMKNLGYMKGDVEEAVTQGAHALFYPHGLGHMMGLDVHDMENLGEDYVGYDENTKRTDQFGFAYLRMGKELLPGHVMTVEPGIYFIPELIDQWNSEKKFDQYINYEKVEANKKFGGIRIEDDVLVTSDGHRIMGPTIPKRINEVEAISSGN